MSIRTPGEAGQGSPRQALLDALRARGIECEVQAHDRLAVIVPRGDGGTWDAARRTLVLDLAHAHGFTHVALEVAAPPAPGSDAPLPRG